MKRTLLDDLWRMGVLAALVWIGVGLHQLHQDMQQPADDAQSAATSPDDDQGDVDELHQQLAVLDQKVDAIMIAMAQLKR